jgi:8-oxo-dGTP diphosphatase
MLYQRPKVGVGVIIIKEGKVLLGKRKNAHGSGTWSTPGGHLEFGESLEECAEREVLEETGLHIKNIRCGPFTNDIMVDEAKHYITIFMVTDYCSGNPEVLEPERCEMWQWFRWDALPQPLFLPIQNLLEQRYDFSQYCNTIQALYTTITGPHQAQESERDLITI